VKKAMTLAIFGSLSLGMAVPALAIVEYTPTNDVALGSDASAIGRNDVAIGSGSANGTDNTNINGSLPYSYSPLENQGTAASSASGTSGSGSVQNDKDATALGEGAVVYSDGSSYQEAGTSIGSFSETSGPNTAIGSGAQAGPAASTSNLGPAAPSSSTAPSNDTAIGGSIYSGSSNIAIGGGTVTTGNGNIAEGKNATSSGSGSVAIGNGATAGKPSLFLDPSTAVGSGATATGTNSEAYGYDAKATATNAEALGTKAQAGQANSVALGSGSTANTAQTGQGSSVTIRGQTYSVAGGKPSGEVSVGSASGGTTRLITNVAAGQISPTSTQAVNGSELYATNQAINNLQVTQSSQGVLHYTTPTGATSSTPTSTASAGTATTGPVTISNVGNGVIAAGSTTAANGNDVYEAERGNAVHYVNGAGQQTETPTDDAELGTGSGNVTLHHVAPGAVNPTSHQAVNGSQLYGAEQGAQADANRAQSNAEGYASQVAGQDAAQAQNNAEGYAAQVAGQDAAQAQNNAEGYASKVAGQAQANAEGYAGRVTAADSHQALQAANAHSNDLFTLTCHRLDNGSGDIVCGRNASVSGQDASAQGYNAVANGNGANAYGAQAQAIGNDATALGNAAQARGYSTTAVGDHAAALAPNSTALGEDATALGAGSVALGYGSVAHRPNSVSVGNAATGLNRQITNVAAGTQPHDAVNLGQFEAGLRGMKSYANIEADKVGSVDASLAAASAEAAAGKHRNSIAGGTAEYNGQASFAFAYQHRFGTHWASMITVGSNGGAANTTVAGAASYSW